MLIFQIFFEEIGKEQFLEDKFIVVRTYFQGTLGNIFCTLKKIVPHAPSPKRAKK